MTRDDLPAALLGQLDSTDQQRLQQALDRDRVLRGEMRRDLEALSHLLDDLDPDAVSVPPGAAEALLERTRAETLRHGPGEQVLPPPVLPPPPLPPAPALLTPMPPAPPPQAPQRERPWLIPAALGVLAATLLGLALRPSPDPVARYARAPGAEQRPIVVGQNTLGALVRQSDGRTFLRLASPAPTGYTYQLWRIRGSPQGPVPESYGTFYQDALTKALPRGAVLAVSLEPPGGSRLPSTRLLFKERL